VKTADEVALPPPVVTLIFPVTAVTGTVTVTWVPVALALKPGAFTVPN
jgi:hypothetical protein